MKKKISWKKSSAANCITNFVISNVLIQKLFSLNSLDEKLLVWLRPGVKIKIIANRRNQIATSNSIRRCLFLRDLFKNWPKVFDLIRPFAFRLFAFLPFCLFVFMFFCPFVLLYFCLFIFLSLIFCPFIFLSFCPFVHLHDCLFVYLSFCLFVFASLSFLFLSFCLCLCLEQLKTVWSRLASHRAV